VYKSENQLLSTTHESQDTTYISKTTELVRARCLSQPDWNSEITHRFWVAHKTTNP